MLLAVSWRTVSSLLESSLTHSSLTEARSANTEAFSARAAWTSSSKRDIARASDDTWASYACRAFKCWRKTEAMRQWKTAFSVLLMPRVTHTSCISLSCSETLSRRCLRSVSDESSSSLIELFSPSACCSFSSLSSDSVWMVRKRSSMSLFSCSYTQHRTVSVQNHKLHLIKSTLHT